MNQRVFDRFHNIANTAFGSGSVIGESNRTADRYLHRELVDTVTQLELDTEEAPSDGMENFSRYVERRFFAQDYSAIRNCVKELMDDVLYGQRPEYWASWAHKSTYTSDLVKDYDIVEYGKRALYKSLMSLFCGIKTMVDAELKVRATVDPRVVMLDFDGNNGPFNGYINKSNAMREASALFLDVFTTYKISVYGTSPFELNIDRGSHSYEHTALGLVANEYVYKLLKKHTKPKLSLGGYDFFVIDYVTLLLCLLYDKFPRQFSLRNEDELYIKAVNALPKYLQSNARHSIINNENVLFVWSKDPIKARALNYKRYSRRAEARLYVDEESFNTRFGEKGILDNKVFFNYEDLVRKSDNSAMTEGHVRSLIKL